MSKSTIRNPRGLRKREGKWHYRFKVNGHEYSGSTGLAATRQAVNDALAVRAQERNRILSGGETKPEIFPFSKAAGQFLEWCNGEYKDHPNSAGRIRTSFASVQLFFRNEPVLNIREGAIENFKTWRRSQRIKEITIRHDLHALSKFFGYAQKQGWCTHNPVAKVDIPSDEDAVRMYILSADEEHRYFEAARQRSADLYDIGRLMVLQGCRPEELMALEQEAVDLARGKFRITKGKSKAAKRTLKMMDESKAILAARLQKPGRWVFPSHRKKGAHITKLNNAHNDACERCGLDFVPYDLRHTAATRWAQDGMDLPTLAAILGHGSLRLIQRYVHVQGDHMDEAMERYQRNLRKRESKSGRSGHFPSTIEDESGRSEGIEDY